MIINVRFTEMTFSDALTESVIGKLNSLGESYKWILKANVVFRNEDPAEKAKICAIELNTPKARLFAFSRDNDFEMAIRDAISKLEKQFRKRKSFSNLSSSR